LMAYSADIGAVYRQSATFVDKIIKRPKAGRPAARDQSRRPGDRISDQCPLL
jgi:hypothetical protein